MARPRTRHRCTACDAVHPQWVGQCPACGAWATLVEEAPPPTAAGPVAVAVAPSSPAVAITQLSGAGAARTPTGVGEVDRVLGGGLVPGSVTLVGGEPGVGKSTLLTQIAASVASSGAPVLYVSAEESATQVRLRAERLGALTEALYVAAEGSLPAILGHLDALQPGLVVIDSIQTVHDPALPQAPGTVAQVSHCTHHLVGEAKARSLPIVLVGHVTKDGALAGPRVLEHVVDTVLSFEGDRHHALRLLRAVKHRFGATGELGVLEMTESGLVDVPDAGGLFLTDRRVGVPGSVVVPTLEGNRALLVEVQALVVPDSPLPQPRRSAQGLDNGRVALLTAVLTQRAGMSLTKADVFVAAVGGVRLTEPGADLAVALAVASALVGAPVPAGVVACGELGLGGEVRQVAGTPRRLAEAARLGFTDALVPLSAPPPPPGIRAVPVGSLLDAVLALGLQSGRTADRHGPRPVPSTHARTA